MVTIGKEFKFEAAHQLPEHDGKCAHLHGHSYRVEVVLQGIVQPFGPKTGMVVDFGDVSRVWKDELEPVLDHQDLNASLAAFGVKTTTAENIATWIVSVFKRHLPQTVSVTVWETETSWALAEAE